jgi:hypothetical protein
VEDDDNNSNGDENVRNGNISPNKKLVVSANQTKKKK